MLDTTGLLSCRIRVQETDLHILADRDVAERAEELVFQYRLQIENYIIKHRLFSATLAPMEEDVFAPQLVRSMMRAGITAGVGPMAAVAGTIAEAVGQDLIGEGAREIIIENGGDIFLQRSKVCRAAIYAGRSPLSNRVGIELCPDQMPMGLCTSSGTVGHSLSLGEADSVTVLARSTPLADAAATRLGNEVGKGQRRQQRLEQALEAAKTIDDLMGVVIICDDLIGAVGDIELVRLGGN
ncbi:MAG: UPF0280 family protein [Thermodesulfobacteriota bacterium]